MIKIYNSGESNFIGTHIADINILSGSSKKKINGLYSFTFTIPIHYSGEIIKDRIIEADNEFYRITRITKKGSYKEVYEVYAESLFQSDMLDDYSSSFIYSDASVEYVLSELLQETRFQMGSCDDLGLKEIALTQKNKSEVLNEVLTIWTGELDINGLEISIKSKIGRNNNIVIRKGKNLKGIEAVEDISNVITRLHYSNKNENLGGTLDSQYISNYANIKNQVVQFDADSQDELDALALKYIQLNEVPYVNYKIDFADLYYTEEYAHVKDLERVDVGDIVTIQHENFGINIQARILELERDIAERKNTKVVLGNFRDNFFDFQVALKDAKDTVDYAFPKRKLNSATLKGLKIVDEDSGSISMEITEKGKVLMGQGSSISWDSITDKPDVGEGGSSYTDEQAIAAINRTYIDGDGVWTPKVYVENIVAGQLKLVEGMEIGNEDSSIKISKDKIEVNDGKIQINDKSGNHIILNSYGIDTNFIKYFKNMIWNSQFERYDTVTKKPDYWTGGAADPNSSFFGTVSLRLAPSQSSQTTGYVINPQWYSDTELESTRVSFYRKFGSVKVEVLGNNDILLQLTDENGNSGTSLIFERTANWLNSRASFSFIHGSHTNVSVRFTNVHPQEDAYIDAVQLEPDFTGRWSSFYTDGANSSPDEGRETEAAFNTLLTDVKFYSDGMVTTYEDASTFRWTFIKDSQGRITQLKNLTENKIIDIAWNSGSLP